MKCSLILWRLAWIPSSFIDMSPEYCFLLFELDMDWYFMATLTYLTM